jgi:hypothetical protein
MLGGIMSEQKTPAARKRTAVLIVHGMGSQRPLDTARGMVDTVWLRPGDPSTAARRIWSHQEQTLIDIDLPVITTNTDAGSGNRRIDFHELYWAHLMSETKAVAVLLWLFELARMGPRSKPSIAPVYWAALVFLAVLMLSVSTIALQLALIFIERVAALIPDAPSEASDFHLLLYVVLLAITVAAAFAALTALWKCAFKLAGWCLGIAAVTALGFYLISSHEQQAEQLTVVLLPSIVAIMAVKATMGRWGWAGLAIVLILSAAGFYVAEYFFDYVDVSFADAYAQGALPWSITSFWSTAAAFYFFAIYLVLYAVFLQPYLGDAARYFRNSPGNVLVRREIRRQAVATLEALHQSGDYDRIVVVAHSLGTVVAYDMLRAYYSRIYQNLPDRGTLGSDFDDVDRGTLSKSQARAKGREIIRHMAQAVATASTEKKPSAWLVTDFVTLGSPLTHALYLMCRGNTEKELRDDFNHRTFEREFPTCPPRMTDGDSRLTFVNTHDKQRYFHHGGLFALTRWTNLYFPVSQLLWGDAIGGEVGALFGDPDTGSNIADVPVYTQSSKVDAFFAHVLYWSLKFGAAAPHIVALQQAIDLADSGTSNNLGG